MPESRKPTYIAFSGRTFDTSGRPESSWSRIGAAFPHKDGKGFNVALDALPTSGRVVLRANEIDAESVAHAPNRPGRRRRAAHSSEPS
jgi:hypothetical protein